MKYSRALELATIPLVLLACTQKQPPTLAPATPQRVVAPVLLTPEAKDIHSYAEPAIARVTHVDLDLTADFNAKTLAGTATLDIEAAPGAGQIVLDTNQLDVTSVTDARGEALEWSLGKLDPLLGAPLTVQLKAARQLVVRYSSRPDAAALLWLKPEQTAGKQKPYLFSQGEEIHTRTWVPTQDSPGIRQTWDARIVAPADLRVVMSGEMLDTQGVAAAGGLAWRFRMDKPVAPYLIAIAIGDIGFKPTGPRTGVYAEPVVLDAAASEFVDMEKMVQAAEALYGPYRWGRYDLVVMPPSFPYGGMENPRLTFVTPTVIAGDRSLVSMVAHELAHSWSGNLVTFATWSDYWLNEGFTVYFEGRIMEQLYGKDVADMDIDLGWDGMEEDIRNVGGMTSPDTRLHIGLAGREPGVAMTDVAYEKGAVFLRTIEAAVGRERWDAYLRDYFDRHAFQPQTTSGFLADLREHMFSNDAALEKSIDLDTWAYGVGVPANAVHIHSARFAQVDRFAAAFAKGGTKSLPDIGTWTSLERVRFLTHLPRRQSNARLAELDNFMALSTQGNSEVCFAWLRLAVANHYEPAVPQLEAFLTSMGRRKFVGPLFTDLVAQGSWGKPIATRIYAIAKPGYHSITISSVDKALGLGDRP